MTTPRTARRVLIATALAASLTLPALQTAQALTPPPAVTAPSSSTPTVPGPTGYDEVDHLGTAAAKPGTAAPAPGGGSLGDSHIPGLLPDRVGAPAPTASATVRQAVAATTAAGVPCTLDGMTGLGPQQLADFLADPAVSPDGCLRAFLWTWGARYAATMDDAHVQAVADRITKLSATDDGTGRLYALWTFLHATVYFDFNHSEIDVTDAPTATALQRAIDAYQASPHAFDTTDTAAATLRELAITAGSTGLGRHNLGLVKKILAKFAPGTTVADSWVWGTTGLAALNIDYLGIANNDPAFTAAVAADADYRAAFRAFAGYGHLKGTANAWMARDAMAEYGRFGQIAALRDAVVADLGPLLTLTRATFGANSDPWIKLVGWANTYGVCAQYDVCADKIEAALFPNTYRYDNGAIEVHTALDKPTVDQMYYASKQVKTQFFRVLGTDVPLAGDVNSILHIHLYASRSDYEVYHPLLTGMNTNNGGIYIENGATFYTYQRRVPQDSTLTLEELFRHEYTHYLNGRWAVPGYFGNARWYANDLTTAMDEGTAEFFDGATRDQGILVRKSLVQKLAQDEAAGIPRLTVRQLIHASYDDTPAFHFYNYAGTFFEFLWQSHPSLLREMYGYQRADDPAGFDAWRTRVGADAALQTEYDAFLDAQIARVDSLYVPSTGFTPNGYLQYAYPAEVRAAFAKATSNTPDCVDNGDWDNKPMRFVCTGKITANLADPTNPDQVFKDMSGTVDYFILQRTKGVANNLDDMNCSFGPVEIWTNGKAGTSSYTCEGPLRR
ncbi:peptidase M9 [Kitasatospora sp. MMS16-BH015]|uniref:collagenase n=1 Tax=Kitasatospora sp. MMS16-BH015 TaxID=2018025 RepID=UPI000CA0E7E1|nr:collagenase [Kitasatospora sp. MMS16-BH015]AUG76176.1 peptidase M9 [Kitasatospora sp. MMS16-BH015]